jgi:MoxR-like ATPase
MEAILNVSHLVREHVQRVVLGQDELVTQSLATILCNGHALIEGVPGVAKTLTVKTIAEALGVGFRRVQGTSDLMPADIIGTNVFDSQTSSFKLHRGPLFTDLLLMDEINRMPPRSQAALLEAMEERQATIDGVTQPLSQSFTVFATQNPVEFEGTYPLPEAQLDRFLLKIVVSYPDAAAETDILVRYSKPAPRARSAATQISAQDLDAARAAVNGLQVEPGIIDYIARITRKTRGWPAITLGASPRAGIALLRVAKAFAALEGRDYVIPDDVKASAKCTLRHRIMLDPEAELEGVRADDAVDQVLRNVEVPR